MTENLFFNKDALRENQNINKSLAIDDEVEYWQDKLLQIKINKVKEDFEFNKKHKLALVNYNQVHERNSFLKSEIREVNNLLVDLHSEDQRSKSKSEELREEILNYESRNSDLFNESYQKINYMKNLQQNPDFLLNHMLKFDSETLKTMCIKLNKLNEEKMHHLMQHQQQQYYNQMMLNQGHGFFPGIQNMYNANTEYYNESNLGGNENTAEGNHNTN